MAPMRSAASKTAHTSYKGVAQGRVIHLKGGVSLPKGTAVNVLVAEPTKGSPAGVLEAMRRLPDLKPGDVDELERMIEQGKRPVRAEGIFDRRRERRR
jgi:hypothetical protein